MSDLNPSPSARVSIHTCQVYERNCQQSFAWNLYLSAL